MIRRNKAEWQELIEEYEASGLSAHAWCEAHGIQRSTFAKHCKLVVESRQSTGLQWMAVEEGPPAKHAEPIQIAIGDCVITVPAGFDGEHLEQICNVLVTL